MPNNSVMSTIQHHYITTTALQNNGMGSSITLPNTLMVFTWNLVLYLLIFAHTIMITTKYHGVNRSTRVNRSSNNSVSKQYVALEEYRFLCPTYDALEELRFLFPTHDQLEKSRFLHPPDPNTAKLWFLHGS